MSFLRYLFGSEYGISMWLYTFLFFFVTLTAFLSQYKTNAGKPFHKKWYRVSFLFALFFYVFNDTGRDLPVYINIYENSSLSVEWLTEGGLEFGYRFINAILHCFIKNPYMGIGIIKTVQLILIYKSIYIFKDEINVGFAVMAYMALFYFISFNLIRISLAGGICFLSTALIFQNKVKKSLLLAILSVSIHMSAIAYLFTIAVYLLYVKGTVFRPIYRLWILIGAIILLFMGADIIKFMLSSGYFMERYNGYTKVEETRGVMQIIFYMPVLLVYLNIFYAKEAVNKKIKDLTFVFGLVGFSVAMLAYSIGMLSRMNIFFFMPFVLFIPYYVNHRKNIKLRFRILGNGTNILLFMYWVARYILTISGVFEPSGLQNYMLIF